MSYTKIIKYTTDNKDLELYVDENGFFQIDDQKQSKTIGARFTKKFRDGSEAIVQGTSDGNIIYIRLISEPTREDTPIVIEPTKKRGRKGRKNKLNSSTSDAPEKPQESTDPAAPLKKLCSSMYPLQLLRTCPFLPINKVSSKSKIYKEFVKNKNILIRDTEYGTIETRNRLLTQRHKMLLDLVMASCSEVGRNARFAKDKDKHPTASINFSLYGIAKRLGMRWGGRARNKLIESLKEIADTFVIVSTKDNKEGISFHIIDSIGWNKDNSCRIILSGAYKNYFYSNLAMNYDKRLDELMNIKGEGSALILSIIDFFMTHKIVIGEGTIIHIGFMKLMKTIGYPTENIRMQRSALEYISKYKADLARFGITYNNKNRTFEYRGTNNVKFIR